MKLSKNRPDTHQMHAIERERILQRWNAVQYELMPQMRAELEGLTPRLERLIHTLEWVRVEDFVECNDGEPGRPAHERAWLANAFVAKAVLGLPTTIALIERLSQDRALRRICGFAMNRRLPSQATFSRAFAQFAQQGLAERAHEALIVEHLGDRIVGAVSRDATAIEARERPRSDCDPLPVASAGRQQELDVTAPAGSAGKPSPGATRRARKRDVVRRQRRLGLTQMLAQLPKACDRGTKSNAQGYKVSWNGYKAHIDTAECGVPISMLVSSASMHDSRAAIPLSMISAQRTTVLYEVMDAAYCSLEIHEHCRTLGHVPLIDHNRRGGAKEPFEAADAARYRVRSSAERTNARLKDEFGGRHVRVRGHEKVTAHLMFGILALAADQLGRLYRRE